MRAAVVVLACGVSCAIAVSGRARHVINSESELKKTCTRCHGLNVVRAQRLSREEWNRELDKMTAMGAKIADRNSLLDYLAKKYSNRIGDPGEGKR